MIFILANIMFSTFTRVFRSLHYNLGGGEGKEKEDTLKIINHAKKMKQRCGSSKNDEWT